MISGLKLLGHSSGKRIIVREKILQIMGALRRLTWLMVSRFSVVTFNLKSNLTFQTPGYPEMALKNNCQACRILPSSFSGSVTPIFGAQNTDLKH